MCIRDRHKTWKSGFLYETRPFVFYIHENVTYLTTENGRKLIFNCISYVYHSLITNKHVLKVYLVLHILKTPNKFKWKFLRAVRKSARVRCKCNWKQQLSMIMVNHDTIKKFHRIQANQYYSHINKPKIVFMNAIILYWTHKIPTCLIHVLFL